MGAGPVWFTFPTHQPFLTLAISDHSFGWCAPKGRDAVSWRSLCPNKGEQTATILDQFVGFPQDSMGAEDKMDSPKTLFWITASLSDAFSAPLPRSEACLTLNQASFSARPGCPSSFDRVAGKKLVDQRWRPMLRVSESAMTLTEESLSYHPCTPLPSRTHTDTLLQHTVSHLLSCDFFCSLTFSLYSTLVVAFRFGCCFVVSTFFFFINGSLSCHLASSFLLLSSILDLIAFFLSLSSCFDPS